MRIHRTSVFVDDQQKALDFYTAVLGFTTKHDIPLGQDRWLTVIAAEDPEGPELLLEPDRHPVVRSYKEGLAADGIPVVSFEVADVRAEFERLRERDVTFTQEPLVTGPVTTAVFDDTCGNLIQIVTPA